MEENKNEQIINDQPEKTEIVGISFREAGKVYYFSPGKLTFKLGDGAIVETARGVEYGIVKVPNKLVSTKDIVSPLKPVMRLATKQDEEKNEKNRRAEADAGEICKKKIADHGLGMDLVGVEYTFDLQLHDLIEGFLGIAEEGGAFRHAGVIYQNVDRAIGVCHASERGADRLQTAQLRADAGYLGFGVGFLQLGHGFFRVGLAGGGDDDGGPLS